MNKKILLDGCSFTYGLHLPREHTLEHYFAECGYNVKNLSRPGKSNHAMALDVYHNIDYADILVVGWSFSSRWHLNYHQQNIDFLANREQLELPHALDSGEIEKSYQDLHKSLYSMFDVDHWNQTSNMLVDNTAAMATQKGKKVVFFSWEPRATNCAVFLPHVPSGHRLKDGHLSQIGTKNLFDKLTAIIEQ